MTNTTAMSGPGNLYRNIDSIESKCAQLISQIDDHLYVSDSRSLITRHDSKIEPVEGVDPIFLCCHRSIVDYSSARKTPQKSQDVANLPKLRIAEEFCDRMTKINQPLPEDLLRSFLEPTLPSHPIKCPSAEPKPASKKRVAFDLDVERDRKLDFRDDGLAFGCSRHSPARGQNRHKRLASTEDAHARPESLIDWQPHVQNGVRPPGNSTAADNVRAFLFGSSKKDGKLPRATKNTISVKTKRDARKKLKRGPDKWKTELLRAKRRKVFFKIDKPIVEHIKNGQEKLSENIALSRNQNKEFIEVEKKKQGQDCRIDESFSQQPVDEVTERKLATQLLKDRIKFCLKNSTKKEKNISFSLS